MTYFDDYRARIQANGITPRDRLINSQRDFIKSNFKDSPSYYSVSINGVTVDAQIIDDSKVKEQKILLTQSTSLIKSGDVVLWNSENWLTLIVDNIEFYYRGTMRKCVSSLKWKNSSSVQKEAYFIFDSMTSQLGVEEGKIVNLGNERRQIVIQSNVDTQAIKKDQRFIFDNRAWRTTAIDGLSYKGLLHITLEEDTINTSVDDTVNRIANNTGTSTGGGLW